MPGRVTVNKERKERTCEGPTLVSILWMTTAAAARTPRQANRNELPTLATIASIHTKPSAQILHDTHENLLPGSGSCQAFRTLSPLSPLVLSFSWPVHSQQFGQIVLAATMRSPIILLVLVGLVASRALPDTKSWQGSEVGKGGRSLSILAAPRRELMLLDYRHATRS